MKKDGRKGVKRNSLYEMVNLLPIGIEREKKKAVCIPIVFLLPNIQRCMRYESLEFRDVQRYVQN